MVIVFTFLRTLILFFMVAVPTYILINNVKGSVFSTPSPAFLFRLFNDGYYDHCEGGTTL